MIALPRSRRSGSWDRDARYSAEASGLADQQLAGLLMWIPGGLVYVLAALRIGDRVLERRGSGLADGPRSQLATGTVRAVAAGQRA